MKQFYLKYFLVVFSRTRLVAAVTIGLLLAAAMLPQAVMAGVEFVTNVGACQTKLYTQNPDSRMAVQAGNDTRFEVWGFGVDLVGMTVVGADNGVTARVIRTHNGAGNTVRGCGVIGSVEVEVDSPASTTTNLYFTLKFGDSSLKIAVVPFRTPVWTFGSASVYLYQSPGQCLTKNIGTIVSDLNDSRLTITLPPGAASDASNCTVEFRTLARPEDKPVINISKPFNYEVGFPAFMTLVSGDNTVNGALSQRAIRFNGNVTDIRRTTATRSNTLTIRTPNNRQDTLTLVLKPPPITNAFTQACQCRNAVTGTTVNVGDAFDCELRLSQTPPAAGQLITFLINDRACVAPGGTNVNYGTLANCTGPDGDGYGTYTALNTGATIHNIPFRALGCNNSTGGACASSTSPVAHTLKFWVGLADTESGSDFTSCQVQIRKP